MIYVALILAILALLFSLSSLGLFLLAVRQVKRISGPIMNAANYMVYAAHQSDKPTLPDEATTADPLDADRPGGVGSSFPVRPVKGRAGRA